jgi:hypothetical protein
MWYDYSNVLYNTLPLSGTYIITETKPSQWSYINEIYVKIPYQSSGTWKQVLEAWIKDGGSWRRFLYVIPTTNLYLNGDYTNLNLRSYYQQQTGDYSNTPIQVNFVLQTGTVAANNTGTAAIDTGIWPAGSQITFFANAGTIVTGKGGDGGIYGCCLNSNFGQGCGSHAYRKGGSAGGPCINLRYPLTIVNNGTMGGGGGGGGSAGVFPVYCAFFGGGGGAGVYGGASSGCCQAKNIGGGCRNAGSSNPTATTGGAGCQAGGCGYYGGNGGALGSYGGSSNGFSCCGCTSFNGGAPGNSLIANSNGWSLYGNSISGPLG